VDTFLSISVGVVPAALLPDCEADGPWEVEVPNDFWADGVTNGFSSLDCDGRGGASVVGEIAGFVGFGGAVMIFGEGDLARALPYLNKWNIPANTSIIIPITNKE
jgi:hypothetical protein